MKKEEIIKLLKIAEQFKNNENIDDMKLITGAIIFKVDGVWYAASIVKLKNGTQFTAINEAVQNWQEKADYIGPVDDMTYSTFVKNVDKFIDMVNAKLGGM